MCPQQASGSCSLARVGGAGAAHRVPSESTGPRCECVSCCVPMLAGLTGYGWEGWSPVQATLDSPVRLSLAGSPPRLWPREAISGSTASSEVYVLLPEAWVGITPAGIWCCWLDRGQSGLQPHPQGVQGWVLNLCPHLSCLGASSPQSWAIPGVRLHPGSHGSHRVTFLAGWMPSNCLWGV